MEWGRYGSAMGVDNGGDGSHLLLLLLLVVVVVVLICGVAWLVTKVVRGTVRREDARREADGDR